MVDINQIFNVADMARCDDGEHRQPFGAGFSGTASANDAADAPLRAIEELKQRKQWVGWKYVIREGSSKPTKPPVNPHNGLGASHSKPLDWGSHKQAMMGMRRYGLMGVGFVLTDEDEYTGIDLDNCRDPDTEELEPWAEAAVALAETYTEVSPSGRGIRMFARGKVQSATKCDPAGVEIYGSHRYMTVTEQHVEGTPLDIRPALQTIEMLLARAEAMRPQADEPSAAIYRPAGGAPPRPATGQAGGSDFFRKVNDRALKFIGLWAPTLIPGGKFSGDGAYRISSKTLGRKLQEDLSIHPSGIVDHGIADMGDPQQGRRSAIDLVIEYGGALDSIEAAKWLCERMGKTPESLGWREGAQRDEEITRIGDEIAEDLIARAGAKKEQADEEAESTAQAGGGRRADPLDGFIFDGDAPLEPPRMLVKKLVPFDGIVFVGGQSGAGKTFAVIDLAVSLASGEAFFDHKVTERVGVAIFPAEGASTIASRVTVARNQKAGGEIMPITWLGAVPDLAKPAEARAMIACLKAVDARFRETHGVRLGAVILDTLAATFSIEDENDNSKAAAVIRAMKFLGDALGVVVLPVHHFGKAAETGLRGASAWRAGCDVVLSVLADRDQTTGQCSNRRLALTKSRVGEEGWTAPFELRFVKLGEDEDGDDFGACYVEPGKTDGTIVTTSKKRKVPAGVQTYLRSFNIIVGDKGRRERPFGNEGGEFLAVDREDIRGEFYRLWAGDGDTEDTRAAAQRKAFKRSEEWAVEQSLIATYAIGKRHVVWLLNGANQ